MAEDTRVVQMEFDNKNFEKNISTSQRSLDRFKDSLDFDATSKGLEKFSKVTKSLSFETLAQNVQKLTDKFTGLGDATEFVLSKIRGKLEQLGGMAMNFVDSMTTVQMAAGFTKYESLNKSVQTLKAATGKEEKEIYGVLERLNEYTDQTSYDFAEGVTSISKLVSSGAADLTTAEKTIEGFYNMAAKAGADTQTASHALQYSLTQAMSMGYMGYNDWKTLEGSSLATIDFKTQLLESAVALKKATKENGKYYVTSKKGTKQKKIEVNATNLWKDSLQQQWVTTEVLNDALGKYQDTTTDFGAEAYAAAQRCTTFTDALNAWKDMMSTGWMQTYRTLFGDLGEAMDLFSGVCDKVSEALEGLMEAPNKILTAWKAVGGYDNLWGMLFGEIETPDGKILFEGAHGVLDIFTEVGDMISEGFWGMVENLIPKSEQDATLKLINDNLSALGLEKPFESFHEFWTSDWAKETGAREGTLGSTLQEATQRVQEFVESIHAWFSEVDENSGLTRMEKIQNVVTAVMRTISFGFEILGGIFDFFGAIGEQLSPSVEAILTLLSDLGISLIETENDVSQSGGIKQFFSDLAEMLSPVTGMINDLVIAFTEMIRAIAGSEAAGEGIKGVFTSIGETIKKVFGTITDILRPVVTFITEVMGIVGDLFRDGFDEESLAAAQEKLSAAFSKMWEGIKAAFQPIIEKIGTFLKLAWATITAKVKEYFDNPDTLGHKIMEPLKKFFGPVWGFLTNLFGRLQELFGKVKDAFSGKMTLFDVLKFIFSESLLGGFVKKIAGLLKGTNLYSLMMGFLGAVALWKLIKMISSWKGVGDSLKELAEKMKNPLKALFGGGKEEREKSFGEKFMELAKGIALVAAAVVVLGSMGVEKAATGVLAVAAIVGIIWGAMKLFSKAASDMSLGETVRMVASFVGFATSIALMAVAMKILSTMSWEDIGKSLAGLGGLMIELIGIMSLMKVAGVTTGSLAGFIGFAFSIGILVLALKPLANMNWEQFGKMMAGLGGVLLELVAFMLLTSYMPIGTGQLGGFIGFALSIGILVLALKPFANMNWEQYGKMMAGLGGVLLELAAFMAILSALPNGAVKMSGFIGFAISIGILVHVIQSFADMSWEQFGKMMAGLGGILLELIAFMLITSFAPIGVGQLGGFIAFAVSIGILVKVLEPFAGMSWEQFGKMMAGLGGILVEMLIFMGLTSLIPAGVGQLGGFIAFAASIALLVFALKPFADINWDQYAIMMAGLGGILAEMLIFMAILSVIPANPTGIAGALAIAVGIGVIALAMSFAMNEIKGIRWEVITAFTAGLATVIVAMAGAITLLSGVPLGAGMKGILLIAAGIAAVVGVIALMAPMLMSSISSGAADMAGKLELISGMLTGFSNKMGQVDEGNISKAEGIFDQLRRLLGKLAGWGKFTGDLDNFAYSMFVLGTGMEIFNGHVGNAVTDLDTNAQAALKFIQDLSGCATDLDTISKLNLGNLVSSIMMLGGAMSIYAYGAKEVQGMLAPGEAPDETTVGSAIQILQAISTGLAEAGGFTIPENMPDETQLNLFGASLSALATAMIRFESAGKGLGDGTEKALAVLDFFKNLKDKLISQEFKKNLGAAIGIFKSEGVKREELAEFGTNIEQLGLAMKTFNESTTTLDESTGERKAIDFSNAVGTLDSLVELQGKLGWEFGPVIQFFAGRAKDFVDLGAEIEALGTALSDFNTKLGGVDDQGNPKLDTKLFDEAITIADKISEYLVKLKTKMGRVGGLYNVLKTALVTGRDYNFTDLKGQITALSEGIGSLGELKADDKLLTVDETTGIFKVVDVIVNYLKELRIKMERVGGIMNTITIATWGRDYNFTDLKQQLTDLGAGLSGLTTFKVGDLPTKEQMEASFPMIDSLLDYMNTLKSKVNGGKGSVGGLYNIVNTCLNGRKFDFTDLKPQLQALGDGLAGLAGLTVDKNGKNIFNPEGTDTVITTVDRLVDYLEQLKIKLPKVGGLANFFNEFWNGHGASFETIGRELGWLGDGLGKMYTGLNQNGSYDSTVVTDSLKSIDAMVSIVRQLDGLNGSLTDYEESSNGFEGAHKLYRTADYVRDLWHMLDYMTEGGIANDGETFTSIIPKIAAFVADLQASFEDLGGIENVQGISNAVSTISNAILTLLRIGKEGAELSDGDMGAVGFTEVGFNLAAGVANGIRDGIYLTEAAARDMIARAKAAAMDAAGEASPSKVFMGIGAFMSIGAAMGIRNETPEVATAAEELGQSAIDSAGSAMSTFASLMSQDIDANPTITPIMDLSNVKAGSDLINGMLGGEKGLSLAGAGSGYSSASIPRSDRTSGDYRGQDLTWINSAIDSLGARIDAMGEKISGMQVVMNTGALVGEVTPGVNRNLGAKAIYGRRRN